MLAHRMGARNRHGSGLRRRDLRLGEAMKTYDPVDDQIDRWKLQSRPLSRCVETVLRSMVTEGIYTLRDPQFQVAVVPSGMIWAYFPIHKARIVVRLNKIKLQPGAKVLLVIPENEVAAQPRRTTLHELAHHFGHVICYLTKHGWIHECPDADRAAREFGLGKFLLRSPYKAKGKR
jgi:hypothetical protein